jgi:tetratricopeptide (TPR) repeat protein
LPLQAYYTPAQLMSIGFATIWLLGLVALAFLAWRLGIGRVGSAALAWLLLFLLPVSGIVPIGGAAIAERYLYLPSVGFVLVVSLFLDRLDRPPAARIALVLAATTLLGAFAWISVDRSRVWRDEISLFSDLVRTTPELVSPHYNLGSAYLAKGRHAEAIEELEQAVRMLPEAWRYHTNLGLAYLGAGREVDALRAEQRAVEIDPGAHEAWDNLGLVLTVMGRWEAAIAACRRSIAIRGDNPVPRLNLVVALFRSGRVDDARAELRTLERLSPGHARRALVAIGGAPQRR